MRPTGPAGDREGEPNGIRPWGTGTPGDPVHRRLPLRSKRVADVGRGLGESVTQFKKAFRREDPEVRDVEFQDVTTEDDRPRSEAEKGE